MRSALPGVVDRPAVPRRRVVIIDDHDFFAACLRAVVDNEPDLEVCDVTSDAAGARFEPLHPDILVIDLSLGSRSGITIAAGLRAQGLIAPILFVSTTAMPPPAVLSALQPCAFVPKTRSPAQLLQEIRNLIASSSAPLCQGA